MGERDGQERLDFTPRVIQGEELDAINGLLRETRQGYRLAHEAVIPQPGRILYVPSIDLAPPWEETVEWSARMMEAMGISPGESVDLSEANLDRVDLRLYPVRMDDQSDEEPPMLIVVDWTNQRIVGLA